MCNNRVNIKTQYIHSYSVCIWRLHIVFVGIELLVRGSLKTALVAFIGVVNVSLNCFSCSLCLSMFYVHFTFATMVFLVNFISAFSTLAIAIVLLEIFFLNSLNILFKSIILTLIGFYLCRTCLGRNIPIHTNTLSVSTVKPLPLLAVF